MPIELLANLLPGVSRLNCNNSIPIWNAARHPIQELRYNCGADATPSPSLHEKSRPDRVGHVTGALPTALVCHTSVSGCFKHLGHLGLCPQVLDDPGERPRAPPATKNQ